MDDARSRISALDSYTKNALHTLKNAVQEALGRTENKITDGIKEERMVWRQNMVNIYYNKGLSQFPMYLFHPLVKLIRKLSNPQSEILI